MQIIDRKKKARGDSAQVAEPANLTCNKELQRKVAETPRRKVGLMTRSMAPLQLEARLLLRCGS